MKEIGFENIVRGKIDCGCLEICSILEIRDWKDEEFPFNQSEIIIYSKLSNERSSIWYMVKDRIKAAWAMLCGKEHLCYDLPIDTDRLHKLLEEYLEKSKENI